MSDEYDLPSRKELRELPKKSIAVYALRCALRVQPFLTVWTKPTLEFKNAVVKLSHEYKILISIHKTAKDGVAAAAAAAFAAAARAAKDAYSYGVNDTSAYSAYAADAATTAADAAKDIIHTAAAEDAAAEDVAAAAKALKAIAHDIAAEDAEIEAAASAVEAAKARAFTADTAARADAAAAAARAHIAAAAYANASNAAEYAARSDYVRLKQLEIEVTDASETGPLGDLWQGSTPDRYLKAKANYDKTIAEWERELGEEEGEVKSTGSFTSEFLEYTVTASPLVVYIDPGDAPAELITDLYIALDALYRAHDGSGLEIVKEERRSMTGELV